MAFRILLLVIFGIGFSNAGQEESPVLETHDVAINTTTDSLPKGCYRNYTAEQGRIIQYSSEECWITITAPPNHTISLYTNFLFWQAECSTSYLKVHDGDFSANYTTLCNENVGPIFSTGNELSVHANSTWGPEIFKPYYDVHYTTTDKGRGCGGKMYGYKGLLGIFTSPMYPNNYNGNGTCEWEIEVPQGFTVTLEFMNFDLGADDLCATDYLKIRDESDGGREWTYCSGPKPANFNSKSNKLTVTYATSGNNSGTGWMIMYGTKVGKTKDKNSSKAFDIKYI